MESIDIWQLVVETRLIPNGNISPKKKTGQGCDIYRQQLLSRSKKTTAEKKLRYFMLLVFMSTLFFIMHCQQTAATELRPIGKFLREDSVLSAWAREPKLGSTNVTWRQVNATLACKRAKCLPKVTSTREEKHTAKLRITNIFLDFIMKEGKNKLHNKLYA
uniref:Uncharacterized protein n=1 Tax=Glossina pallidipes TaxID=7398 RepID=A0A1B0A9E4_GLOPL